MRITEGQLRQIIREEILRSSAHQGESVKEGLKEKLSTAALAAVIGFGSLFGCTKNPSTQTQEKVASVVEKAQDQLKYTDKDLDKVIESLEASRDDFHVPFLKKIRQIGHTSVDAKGNTPEEKRASVFSFYVAEDYKRHDRKDLTLKAKIDKILKRQQEKK